MAIFLVSFVIYNVKQRFLRSFKSLLFQINIFTPLHSANFTHHHEKTESLLDDVQLRKYFNISSPVGLRDKKYVWGIISLITVSLYFSELYKRMSSNKPLRSFCFSFVKNKHLLSSFQKYIALMLILEGYCNAVGSVGSYERLL